MKPGDLVRHKKMPDWGVGVVVDITAGKCTINFDIAGQKVLQLAIATTLLDSVPPSECPPESALLDPGRWEELAPPLDERTKAQASKTTRMTARCEHCGKLLNRSQYSSNRKMKSCPKCSADDGKQHVFYDYPDAFGRSDARETEETEGAQSYCVACRVGGDQNHASRACSAVS